MNRRIGASLASLVLGGPLLLIAIAAVRFRHVPFAPPAGEVPGPAGTLTLTYQGITGYELTDGKTTVLLDPVVTRPTAPGLFSGRMKPDEALAAKVFPRADFILIDHAHHDHAVDAPAIALRTGATIVGSRSACNLALSRGVPPAKIIEAVPGTRLRLGTFTVDVRASRHIDLLGIHGLMTGTISDKAGPLWFWQYVQDAALAYRLESSGSSVWFHPTSTFRAGEIGDLPATTLIMGTNGEALTDEKMKLVLAEAKPKLILPTHWDNLFQPFEKGPALMPGLDLTAARATAGETPWLVLGYGRTITLPRDRP
jgi:L-ascorbate metabolism protein UlaG (beta-lactamase superfamily)